THTRGGAPRLQEISKYPVSHGARLNHRRATLDYSLQANIRLPSDPACLDPIDPSLARADARPQLSAGESGAFDKLTRYAISDADETRIKSGILACVSLLQTLQDFVGELRDRKALVYGGELQTIQLILDKLEVRS